MKPAGARELDGAESARVDRLFAEVLDLAPPAREIVLGAHGDDDPRVVAEVRALLGFADDASRGPMDRAERGGVIGSASASMADAIGGADPMVPTSGAPIGPGAIVGRYRIMRALGAGGMGVVYLAEQEKPRRTVALKIVRPGLVAGRATGSILRRFEHEAELLGRLQHPGIAQIIEAGTIDSGAGAQPYFAMEYVDGRSLRAYADDAMIDVSARLALVIKLCEAIEHAHQRGVIHRDLKPENILVGADGQPKVLDFGVARATRVAGVDATQLTQAQHLLGTLAYMGPEQASGDPDAVDTRSDVYAIGAILFELLSGALPHDLAGTTIVDAIRIIREREPRRLAQVRPELRGDLDVICAKALAGERARRYQSAAELAADLNRFLRHEPIAARPPSTTYQLVKFARRRRGLVAGFAVAALALVAGVVASVLAWQRASNEAAKQAEVARFLREMLEGVDPAMAQGRDSTVLRQILDRTSRRVDLDLAAPEVQVALLETIGSVSTAIADFPRAKVALESALRIEESEGRADGPQATTLIAALGQVKRELEEYGGANELAERAAALHLARLGAESAEYAQSLEDLSVLRATERRFEEAEPLLRRSLAIREGVFGGDSPQVARTLRSLAYVLAERSEHADAVAASGRALAIVQRHFPADHPEIATTHGLLGASFVRAHDFAAAEPELRMAMDMNARLLGIEHAQTVRSMLAVAQLLKYTGRREESDRLVGEWLDAIGRRCGAESVAMAMALWAVADYGLTPERTLDTYERALAVMRLATNDNPESTLPLKESVAAEAAAPRGGDAGRDRAIEIGRELERDFAALGAAADPRRVLPHIVVFCSALADRAWARRDVDRDECESLLAEADVVLARSRSAKIDGARGWERPLHGARAATTIARIAVELAGRDDAGAPIGAQRTAEIDRELDAAAADLDLAADVNTTDRAAQRSNIAFFGSKSVARWGERLDEARRNVRAMERR